MIDVVAALIRRGERIFVCQRPPEKKRGGLWEFPGGKVEPGESLQQALARECREELGIGLSVGEQYMQLLHDYPDMTVRLTLFSAETPDEPQLCEHTDARWLLPEEMSADVFCPADKDIINALQSEPLPGPSVDADAREVETNGNPES